MKKQLHSWWCALLKKENDLTKGMMETLKDSFYYVLIVDKTKTYASDVTEDVKKYFEIEPLGLRFEPIESKLKEIHIINKHFLYDWLSSQTKNHEKQNWMDNENTRLMLISGDHPFTNLEVENVLGELIDGIKKIDIN